MNLPEEIQNKILLMANPTYSYMIELKQVHNLIKDFSEEYGNSESLIAHKFGLHKWFEHARMVRDEPRGPTEDEFYLQLIEQQCIENGAYRW